MTEVSRLRELAAQPESEVDRIMETICAEPLGWHDERELAPMWAHNDGRDGHQYEATCAICRASDKPDALRALVQAVLDAAAANPVVVAALCDVAEAAKEYQRCHASVVPDGEYIRSRRGLRDALARLEET